jgi:hypothetical protein
MKRGVALSLLGINVAMLLAVNYARSFVPEIDPIEFTDRTLELPPLLGQNNGTDVPKKDASLEQLFLRPLFSPTRRPFEKKLKAKPVIEAEAIERLVARKEAPEFRLIGIAIDRGQYSALFELSRKSESHWFRAGEKIGEWELIDITEGGVSVRCGASSDPGCKVNMTLYPAENNVSDR